VRTYSVVIRGGGSERQVLGVIDGDLQHPPHVLSKLLSAIDAGADLAVPAAMWKAAASVAGALWRFYPVGRS